MNRHLPPDEMKQLPDNEQYRTEKAIFEKAAAIRHTNKGTQSSVTKRKKHDFVLNGLLYCAECGQILEGASAKKTPKLEMDLSVAEDKFKRLEGTQKAAFSKLKAFGDEVPDSFLGFVRDAETDLKATKKEVTNIKKELKSARNRALDREKFMKGLGKLANKWNKMKPSSQNFFLQFVKSVNVHYDGKITMQVYGTTGDYDAEKTKQTKLPEGVSSVECIGSASGTRRELLEPGYHLQGWKPNY